MNIWKRDTEKMIETLRYKAENIKAHIEPEFFIRVANRLEEYKELDESWNFSKQPCNVGDLVYQIIDKDIYTLVVSSILIEDDEIWVDLVDMNIEYLGILKWHLEYEEMRKKVFFTREEAEKELKRLECAENE
jgi:hypothetical protein